MGRAEAFAMQNPPALSFIDGVGNGLGYALGYISAYSLIGVSVVILH